MSYDFIFLKHEYCINLMQYGSLDSSLMLDSLDAFSLTIKINYKS